MADDEPELPPRQDNVWDYVRRRSDLDREIQEKFARPVTVMFTDIKGSTTFFDMRGDLEGVTMLQRHNELVVPPIENEGGRVLQRLGDGLLAVFPGPTPGVRAGIEIQKRLAAFNAGQPARDQIHVRVGLNTGMGLVEHSNVFGDAVNVAARVQTLAEPDQILVSDSVYEEARRDLGPTVFLAVGPAALKGKLEKVVVYEVVWSPEQARSRTAMTAQVGGARRVLHVSVSRVGGRLKVTSRESAGGDAIEPSDAEECAFDEAAIDDAVHGVDAIVGGADSNGRITTQHLEDLRARGHHLWQALLPSAARQRLLRSTAAELELTIDDRLARIPWELLHDGREFLSLRYALGRVVTGATSPAAAKPREGPAPLKVAVVADPRGDVPDALREGAWLITRLGDRPQYQVAMNEGSVNRAEFLAHFGSSDIVHVAGPCGFDAARAAASGLLLADGWLTAVDLGGLPAAATVPRLVFFNAWGPATGGRAAAVSAAATAMLAAGVKHFVCSARAVTGTTGFQFSDDFYNELAGGHPIGLALREARRAAARRDGKTALAWASYVLYGDPTSRYVTPGAAVAVLPGRRPFSLPAAGAAALVAVAAGALWLVLGSRAADARLDDAYLHLASGRHEAAARGFEAVVKDRPGLAYEGLALVALRQNDAAAAQRFCASAQALGARRPGCLLVEGDSFTVRGETSKAAGLYDSVISHTGVSGVSKAIAYNRLGRLSAEDREPARAAAAYAKAQEADPSSAEALSNTAVLLRRQGKYAEATRALEKAASLHPTDALIQTLLEDTRASASHSNDADSRRRVDALVDELAARFKRGDVLVPATSGDDWTSRPLTVSLIGLESRGHVALREGEGDFLLIRIGQILETHTRARLVDRAVMDKLLTELKLGSSALADPRAALQLGRVLSARVISVGSLAGRGSDSMLTLRMIETESAAVIASVAHSFSATQSTAQVADAVARDLAAKLRRAFPLRARVTSATRGEVMLNIGGAEGAALGQKLLILKDGAGGAPNVVSEVEIVEVGDRSARAKMTGEAKPTRAGQRVIERF